MELKNFVIDKVLRAWMKDKSTGEHIFYLIDVKDASFEVSGEQVYTTGSVGQKIAAFDRGTEAKFTASSSLFDFNLLAAQLGGEKQVATTSKKMKAPCVDILQPVANKLTLTMTPATPVTTIYSLNKDGSTNKAYSVAGSATATAFAISGKQITLPTLGSGSHDGTNWLVEYEAEYANAVSVMKSVDDKPASGVFTAEVLFADPCDIRKQYHGYVTFPNGKLTNEVNIEMNTEAAQQFVIEAMQDWCSIDKKLFNMVVVQPDAE